MVGLQVIGGVGGGAYMYLLKRQTVDQRGEDCSLR